VGDQVPGDTARPVALTWTTVPTAPPDESGAWPLLGARDAGGNLVALELDDLVRRHDDLAKRSAELRRHL
jgi:hypothetical protein